jgi:hypothetical protein
MLSPFFPACLLLVGLLFKFQVIVEAFKGCGLSVTILEFPFSMNNLQFLIFEPPEKVKRPNLLHSYDHIFSKITSTSPLFPPPRGYRLLTVGLAITMKTIYSILAFLAWSTVAIAQTSSDVLVGPQTTLQTFVSVRTILETITSVETSVWTAVVTSGGSTFISKSSFAPPRENYS